jgi:two-component system CheB/CheR fusion protein
MDLISCRNLLIYLEAPMQTKVLSNLHYALKPGGLLFVGKAENVRSYCTTLRKTIMKQAIWKNAR